MNELGKVKAFFIMVGTAIVATALGTGTFSNRSVLVFIHFSSLFPTFSPLYAFYILSYF